ncbi:hypothetical protein ACHWQZ_G004457 [Mnemiopsis leidyi]
MDEKIITLEENENHPIEIKFGYPPSIATSSANKTVNLTKCVPDIRYMGVVQQVEFYPLLLVKRSPYITFHGIVGRSNSEPQCEFNKNLLGQECVIGLVNSVELTTVVMDVSREHLMNYYDQMRFIIIDGSRNIKTYIFSLDDDGQNITALQHCSETILQLPQPDTEEVLVTSNYTITFTADPSENFTELKIEERKEGASAVFTCSPICSKTNNNACLSTKSFTVLVRILLRNVIRNLQMTTIPKTCPDKTEWVEGFGCQCRTPYSYFHHTTCSICSPGQLCSPLANWLIADIAPKNDENVTMCMFLTLVSALLSCSYHGNTAVLTTCYYSNATKLTTCYYGNDAMFPTAQLKKCSRVAG